MQPCFADLRSRSAMNANLWSCLRSDCCFTFGALVPVLECYVAGASWLLGQRSTRQELVCF
jgi:hypothetical protein